MQYQTTSSYRCDLSCSSSSPPCPCFYSYCQPHRYSNAAQYSHTTIHHHYHYLPHPSISSPSSSPPTTLYCRQYYHNIPTCMVFSPTKNPQSCNCKPSTSNNPTIAPTSSITFKNHHHQQREQLDPKKCKLLTHSIQELIQSERDYVEDLYIMVEICLAVLQQKKWASTRHVAIMSRNSSNILAFHHRVLSALNACTNKSIEAKCQIISRTFLDHQSEFMALYVDYCDGHSKAWNLCTEYRAKSEWPEYIIQCQSLINKRQEINTLPPPSSNKRIRFEDFLIKPIQRICRYQLLLKEIIRHTMSSSPSSSPSSLSSSNTSSYHSILTQAFKCMHHIATEIDRQNEKKEYQERTYRFIQRLESDWRLSRHRVAQLGCLVISGALDIQYYTINEEMHHPAIVEYGHHPHDTTTGRPPSFPSPPPSPVNAVSASNSTFIKSRYLGCFIFSSYIIMVQVKKQTLYDAKHWFPLNIVDLVDQDNENEFRLQCHEHIFICTASCLREKQVWIDKIRSAQHLLSQQQQQTPEGLVSSLSNHPFSSTRFVNSHHQQPLLRSSTAFFSSDNYTYQYYPSRSSKSEAIPTSSSSPSLLLAAANEQGHRTKIKKNRSLSTHFTTSTPTTQNTNPSSSSPSSPTFSPTCKTNHPHISTGKQQPPPRRHSSLDLFTMATHNLNRVSLHFKAHHRNAIRDAVDQRIRDVCTRDYLSSRARHLALDRKSGTAHALPPPSSPTTVSPLVEATTSSVSSVSPSPSPSTPVPNTITSSSVSSSPLLVSTSVPYHSLHNQVPSPALYPLASSPLPMHQTPLPSSPPSSSTPGRSRRSNPKSPLKPFSHSYAKKNDDDNDDADRQSELDTSRKPSSTTVTEFSPHTATTKKGHRRVSHLLQSFWHRLSRTKKHAHHHRHQGPSFMTKMEVSQSQCSHVPPAPMLRGPTITKTLHPMSIQEEQEDNHEGSHSITMHSDFHLYRRSLKFE